MLKKKMFAVATAVALCATAFASTAQAKAAKGSSAAATSGTSASMDQSGEKASSRAIPFYGKIGTVDKANKTFTIEGKKSTRTFSATDSTKMEKAGGVAATWDDLKPGEYIRGSATKKAEGQYTAMSIKIGQKEKTASAAQSGKSKKQQ
jgi:hypothetical protein